MEKKDLQLISFAVVVESQLPKAAKTQLINFIKEASDIQLKVFLMDGEIISVDANVEQIITERFNAHPINEAGGRIATLRKSYMTQVGASAGVYWLLYRKIRSMFDECTNKCGRYELNTARRQVCMAKCRVDKYSRMMAAAKKTKNEKEVVSSKAKYEKAKQTYDKYVRSFQKRGSEL